MTCQNCGSETLPDQRFCRSCGASLRIVTKPLAAQATSHGEETEVVFADDVQRRSRLVAWGFIMMFVGAAIGLIGKRMLHEEILAVVGGLIALAGIFLTCYPYLWPSVKTEASNRSSERELPRESQQQNQLPEGSTEYVPSVTERTTDLLKSSEVRRPKTKDDKTIDA